MKKRRIFDPEYVYTKLIRSERVKVCKEQFFKKGRHSEDKQISGL